MAKDKKKPDEDLSALKGLQEVMAVLQSQINQKPIWVRQQYLMLMERLSQINQAKAEDFPKLQDSFLAEMSAFQQTVDQQLKDSLEKMKEAVMHQRFELLAMQSNDQRTKEATQHVFEALNKLKEKPLYPVLYKSPWRRFLEVLFSRKHKKSVKKAPLKSKERTVSQTGLDVLSSKKPRPIEAKKSKIELSKSKKDQRQTTKAVKKPVKSVPVNKHPKQNVKMKQRPVLDAFKKIMRFKGASENALNKSSFIDKKIPSSAKKSTQGIGIKKPSSQIQSKWVDVDALDKPILKQSSAAKPKDSLDKSQRRDAHDS